MGETMKGKLIKSLGSAKNGGEAVRCEEAQMLLDQYAHGELNPALAEAVSRHLADCRECAAELEAVSATGAALRQALSEPPQVDLFPLIAERCRRPGRSLISARLGAASWALSGAVAVCIFCIVAFTVWQTTRTSPAPKLNTNWSLVKESVPEQPRPRKAVKPSPTALPNAEAQQLTLPQTLTAGRRQISRLVRPVRSHPSAKHKQIPLGTFSLSTAEEPADVSGETSAGDTASNQPELVLIAEPETADTTTIQERPSFYSVQFPGPAFDNQPVHSLKVYNQTTPEGPVKVVDIDFALPNGALTELSTGKRGAFQ